MSILEGVKNQEEKDQLLAVAMHPKVLAYCEQLRDRGIDFEIVRVSNQQMGETRK